jgi:Transposase, Mutator family
MPELEVLSDGQLKMPFLEWKDFFAQEWDEWVRSQVKKLIEQALELERDYHMQSDYYEHQPGFRFDYRNGYYFRDFATKLGRRRRGSAAVEGVARAAGLGESSSDGILA